MQKDRKSVLLLFLCLSILSSCSGPIPYKITAGALATTASGIFLDPKVNLRSKNYAAADFIQSKMVGEVSRYKVIIAEPMEELDHPGISSPLGRAIPEGVGLRLSELGYNVLLHDVAPYDNADLYPKPKKEVSADFVLKGFYAVKVHDVDVILHIINPKTNEVVARFDYSMVLSREIKKMAKTEPKVFRIEK